MVKRPNKRLSTILRGSLIPPFQDIASTISCCKDDSEFNEAFALAVAEAKIICSRGSGVTFRNADKFPFGLCFERKHYVVEVVSGLACPDLRQKGLRKYGVAVQRRMDDEGFHPEGVVCFLPYSMHDKKIRARFPHTPAFTLVDIGYDGRTLETLAREFS